MACMTFSFFSFLFAVCKDSWEDLTDVVEQLRDDTEGACHTNIFQLLFPLMIGFYLIILSLSAKYSFLSSANSCGFLNVLVWLNQVHSQNTLY